MMSIFSADLNSKKTDIIWFLILLLAALFLWLINLGNLPLRDWDEGYYGTVAKDMYHSGNWLYLTYYKQPFLLKPPLIIWLINLSYQIGGINEFTTRFPCAFLTACGVPLLYLVGRNLFYDRLPAIFSSLVYLTLLPVVRHGRLAMIDGMINTFFIVGIFCLLKSRKQPNWAIGIGISLGLIALSKGILAIALGGILAIYCLFDNPKYILKNPALLLGLILGFLPVFTWYILQINHYGELFIEVHFKQQNFDRLSTSVEGNKGSIFYYFIELLKYSFPWLIFLPTSLKLAWEKRQENWAKLCIIGLGLFMGIISLMGTKLPWYIMPIYPLFSLVIAAYLAKLYQEKKSYPQFLAFFLFMGSGIVLIAGIYVGIEENKISLLIITFLLTITLFSAAGKLKNKSPNFIAILGIGLYISLGSLMISPEWIWELNESFAVKPVATLIRQNTPPGTIIYTSFPYSRTSLDFYSDRQVLAENKDNLQKLASQTSYLLLEQNVEENLKLYHGKILGEAEGFILLKTFPESK